MICRFVALSILALPGCVPASLGASVAHSDTLGVPADVRTVAVAMESFGDCLGSIPNARVRYFKTSNKGTVALPDVGSYKFFVELIPEAYSQTKVTTWVAGWAPETLSYLTDKYAACGG